MGKKKEITLISKDEELAQELQQQKKDLDEALVLVREFTIKTQEDVAFAEESRALTKGQWKEYEEKRTSITEPLNTALKRLNSWFKPVQNVLKDIEAEWSRKLVEAKRAAEAEQQRLIEQARASEEPAIMREALIAASSSILETSSVKFRDHWVFEIVNEAEIPREYLCPDEKKIGGVVAALKDKTNIPGIKVINQPIVSGPSK